MLTSALNGLQMLADIRPNEEHAKEHIERNPVTTIAQVVPEMSEHEVVLLHALAE